MQLAKNVKRANKCARYSLYAMVEVLEFLQALSVDFDHTRNFVYSLVSVASGYSPMLMSLLLLDVLNKNRSLQKVMDIFKNNQDTMVATIILNFIFLYIFSFIAFTFFRRDYVADEGGEDEYKMYCDDLLQCVLSTVQAGLRIPGGIGAALTQPSYTDASFGPRWVFDLIFFFVINIVLINVFFGLIIDAFADMRALRAEKSEESDRRCFICGITK